LTKRIALVAVTIAVALLLLTAFSLQNVLYSQITQQSSYAQKPAVSPITDGNASSSPPPGNSSSSSFVEPGPLPVEPDRGPGGQPGEPGGPTEPQQPPPPQTVDDNFIQTDGILTATINGANFVRNQTISVEGKVDDEVITPESEVWITVKDSKNETTHAIFVPVNPSDKSFSYSIVAGYYDRNSRGFWTPMTVSGKNYTMTVAYNTDNGPSSTPSGNNKSSSEVQFVFAYDHSSTIIPPPVSAAVTAEEEDTGPASAASQFAGNQSTTGNQSMTTTTTTNMTTTAPAPPPTKTNGLLTASINGTHFTTNQTIAVNGTVGKAAGPFITVYVELKDPHNDTLAFEFAPIVRSNKSGSDNETSFSYRLVAGDDGSSQDDSGGHNRRFWKPMNETGNNYTMTVGYATPAPSSPGSVAVAGGGGGYSRSEVQFVFAYEHLLPPEEEEAAAVATTTPAEEPEPEPAVEPEEPEEEVSEEDGEDCDNSYPDECIPPPPPVLECSDIDEDDFEVRGSDPHGFDDDNDGMGCETAPQA
jgi:hypothetical protein